MQWNMCILQSWCHSIQIEVKTVEVQWRINMEKVLATEGNCKGGL